MTSRQAFRSFGRLSLFALAAVGCYSTGNGPDAPLTSLYFPVAMAVSPGGGALYLASSDFDLQYNSGTVLALNLDGLRETLRPLWSPKPPDPDDPQAKAVDPCVAIGLGANTNPIILPGLCGPLDLGNPPPSAAPYVPLVRSSARIGAFATDMMFVCQPGTGASQGIGGSGDALALGRTRCRGDMADPRGARLFVPVRGDPSLTFFDVDDDRSGQEQTWRLECGQASNKGRCSDQYRSGIDPNDNTRLLSLPPEPFGIAISDRADAIAITHQSGGAVSLFAALNGNNLLDVKPTLQFVYGGVPLATGIVALPIPQQVLSGNPGSAGYLEGFGVVYRGASQVDVYRFLDDTTAAPARPFLARSSARGFDVIPSGIDSRDVTIDASERNACQSTCALQPSQAAVDTCLLGCAQIPYGAYVTNRSPPALLIGQVLPADSTLSNESIAMFDSVALPAGPSRVMIGQIHDRRDPPDVRRPRIFAICFDSRSIIVYDPIARRVDGQIRTGRGPHAIAMDPKEPIAYITHFTDSYVGLVDLDQSHDETFESIVATIGVPTPPRESK